jgi:hypothetical protein
MKTLLLGAVAIASAFMIQSVPASAQGACGVGYPCAGRGAVGHGPARAGYQHRGYAPGYGRGYGNQGGYGVGAGVAALAAGALIGGAIASQNQAYYGSAGPATYDAGGSVAYCEQTYRSYDPASGTYLGFDGFRHPCP